EECPPAPLPPLASSKLDPVLRLTAVRAAREKSGLRDVAVAAAATGSHELRRVTAVGDVPLGVKFLAASLSVPSVRALAKADLVQVLVDVRDAKAVAVQVAQWQGETHQVTATTLAVHTPRARLQEIAALEDVRYVESSARLRPHGDLAHLSSRLVRAGVRSVPQTGRGVLVGVIDTGIDAAHPSFTSGGTNRIVRYWDQESGVEHTAAAIAAGQAAASPDVIGHGTHVAGIAAGNGGGSPNQRYQGVAPEADLAIVKTSFMTADIARAIRQVFDLADQRAQPCVVNLSLGGHYGGHDGTTVAERAVDQLCGRGRIVVVSAGNEANDRIHAGTELPRGAAQPARWVADLELVSRAIQGDLMGLLTVQVWHQHEDDLLVRLRSPNGELFSPPRDGSQEFDRSVFFVEAVHQVAPYSGDHSTTFQIATVAQSQWLRGWSVIVEEDRGEGRHGVQVGAVHAWILDREQGHFSAGFTRSHLIGMPGTAYSAITVGSYASRREWTSRDATSPNVVLDQVHLEDISYFSSPGPTRDGDTKPEIAAPGQWLIAPLSQRAEEAWVPLWTRLAGSEYASMQGTSMAAPYVTGALALLLEKEPNIDWAEAKRRLIKSARQDAFTWPCWNSRWGYGKIDVEKLLRIEP
ncbi:MAG TPA: S8 family serine peptidase, partial [Thermoanaerobaculia bacterium]